MYSEKCALPEALERTFFFLPTIYGVGSVSLNFKPTSHVNTMKLAMAVLCGSKNLWSSFVLFFCVAVSFIAVLSVSRGWFHYSPYKQGFLVLSRLFASPHFFCIFYACSSSSCNNNLLLCGHEQCTAHLLSPFLGYFAVAAEVVVNVVHTSPCW